MPRFSPADASVRVLTMREGIASAVGHDVEIEVGAFTIDVSLDPPAVEATLDPGSLRVLGAVRDGRLDQGALNRMDRAIIDRATKGEVLQASRFKTISFRSTEVHLQAGRARVQGTLALRGASRPIAFEAVQQGDRLTADVVVHQPSFGIEPYTAFFGALKVKADVVVRVSLPLSLP